MKVFLVLMESKRVGLHVCCDVITMNPKFISGMERCDVNIKITVDLP
jgi:hypothetical protein